MKKFLSIFIAVAMVSSLMFGFVQSKAAAGNTLMPNGNVKESLIDQASTSFTLHIPSDWSIISIPFNNTDPPLLTSNINIQTSSTGTVPSGRLLILTTYNLV